MWACLDAAMSGKGQGRAARSSSRKKRMLSEEEKQEIKEAFNLFDSDKDEALDYYELKVAIRALGFEAKKAEVQKMIRDCDIDESGKITYKDFFELSK